jgi:hypothetical protein
VDGMSDRRQPTSEQRDERVSLPLDPDVALEALLETGPHPEDDKGDAEVDPEPESKPN